MFFVSLFKNLVFNTSYFDFLDYIIHIMSEFPQIERILKIIQILSSGAKITTSALLQRFDNQVSLRTLQRDLNRIGLAGIPLRSQKITANENEWYLDSHFRSFIPQTLGLNEYLASHMLRENLKVFRDTNFSSEVDSLIRKIEQIVPDHKPDWYHVKLLVLQMPLQVITWILRDIYINGETFTMEGKRMRMEQVVCPEEQQPEEQQPKELKKDVSAEKNRSVSEKTGAATVISFSDLKKK